MKLVLHAAETQPLTTRADEILGLEMSLAFHDDDIQSRSYSHRKRTALTRGLSPAAALAVQGAHTCRIEGKPVGWWARIGRPKALPGWLPELPAPCPTVRIHWPSSSG